MRLDREKRNTTEVVDEDWHGERRLVYRSYDKDGRCDVEAAFPLSASPEDIAARFEMKAVEILTLTHNDYSAEAILRMVAFLKNQAKRAKLSGGPFER